RWWTGRCSCGWLAHSRAEPGREALDAAALMEILDDVRAKMTLRFIGHQLLVGGTRRKRVHQPGYEHDQQAGAGHRADELGADRETKRKAHRQLQRTPLRGASFPTLVKSPFAASALGYADHRRLLSKSQK